MKKLQINIDAGWDYGLSEIYFEDEVTIFEHKRGSSIGALTNWSGGTVTMDDFKVTARDTKSNKRLMARYLFNEVGVIADTIKEIMEGWAFSCVLDEVIDGLDGDEMIELFDELGVKYDAPDWVEFVTRGYSQGDYATCWAPSDMVESMGERELQTYIDNLYWDAPIVGELSLSFEVYPNAVTQVVEVEFEHLDEVLEGLYIPTINGDAVIDEVKKKYPALKKDEEEEIRAELAKFDYSDVKSPCACAC